MKERLYSAALACLFIIMWTITTPVYATQTVTPMVCAGYDHSLGLNKYGRVYAAGNNGKGQCNTFSWRNVVQIAAGKYFSSALFSNGTVTVVGEGSTGFDASACSKWKNIIQIAAGDDFIAGLTSDKTVLVAGITNGIDPSGITEVEKIAAGKAHIIALKSDGSCANIGTAKTSAVDKWSGIVDVFAGAGMSVGLYADGTITYAGEAVIYQPKPTAENPIPDPYWMGETWTDIKSVSIGTSGSNRGITVAVKNDGTVVTDAPTETGELNNNALAAYNVKSIGDADSISVSSDNNSTHMLVLKTDATVQALGSEVASNDIMYWNLDKPPLDFKQTSPAVTAGYKSVFLSLPSGKVKNIGSDSIELDKFKNIWGVSAALSSSCLVAIDSKENAVSSLSETEDDYGMSAWNGLQKLETCGWSSSNAVIGLRWDGLVYSTSSAAYAKNLVFPIAASSARAVSLMAAKGTVVRSYYATDVESGNGFFVILNKDKTATAYTSNSYTNNIDVSGWKDVEKISAGYDHVVGVRTDGTCVFTGQRKYSFSQIVTEDKAVTACDAAANWTDIKEIAAGYKFTVGLKNDGTCVFDQRDGLDTGIDVSSWHDVEKIYAGNNYCIGYTSEGGFLVSGKGVDSSIGEIKKLESCTLNDDGLTRLTTVNNVDGTYSFSYEYDGITDKKNIFAILFDENDNIVSVSKRNVSGLEADCTITVPTEGAAYWQMYVWDSTLTPIFTRKGTFR